MAVISFTKVNLPWGCLGNMAPYPITYEGKVWPTSEALFQALRFKDPDIREEIRIQKSPMAAKMKAKKHRASYMVVEPMSDEDIQNMRLCLKLKFTQHPGLKSRLMVTKGHTICEDIGKRRGSRHEFWGSYRNNENQWIGNNMLGKLLMELRDSL